MHWHRTARDAVAPFGPNLHARFKRQCDDYFFLKHRGEPRGIGGLFFDDFNELGFDRSFALTRAVGDAFLPAYRPIVASERHSLLGLATPIPAVSSGPLRRVQSGVGSGHAVWTAKRRPD